MRKIPKRPRFVTVVNATFPQRASLRNKDATKTQ